VECSDVLTFPLEDLGLATDSLVAFQVDSGDLVSWITDMLSP